MMPADAFPSIMHRRPAPKSLIPYSVFDAHRFLQTALQSLHEMMRRAG
jgi:hypothetical protein